MCLTEIASVKVNQYDEQFLQLFSLVMTKLKEVSVTIIYIYL